MILWGCFPSTPLRAADPAQPIRSLEAALRNLQSQGGAYKFSTVAKAVAPSFDLDAMVNTLLGGATASADERDRLSAVLVARITRELNRQRDRGPEGKLRILRTRAIGKAEWLVTTAAAPPRDQPIVLAWRVSASTGRPLIVDVLRDGASALAPLRRDLTIALQRQDLDAVISQLEQRYAVPGR